ncbi:MAG: DUF4175 domain-containing protein [Christensenellaceae bacterium]|nr:DUF4175 domain-containing protein [Christensenellaceae bacterium]
MRAIKWLIGVFAALLLFWVALGLLLRLMAALVIAVAVLLTAGVIAAAVYAMIRMHR